MQQLLKSVYKCTCIRVLCGLRAANRRQSLDNPDFDAKFNRMVFDHFPPLNKTLTK